MVLMWVKRYITAVFVFVGCFLACLASYGQTDRLCVDSKPLRVLAIGNSFSEDGLEYLDDIASQMGESMVIGNVFLGGCSLETHLYNALQNLPLYIYQKSSDLKKTEQPNVTMLACILDEPWDYISLQQSSPYSGIRGSYEPELSQLISYIKLHIRNSNAKFVLHQTWAYAKITSNEAFANYGRNQLIMYDSIVTASKSAANNADIALVIPSGTAIQNGRQSALGDTFCREDGYHLSFTLGRYTAALVWYEALFNRRPKGLLYAPLEVSEIERDIVQKAAHNAVLHPWKVSGACAMRKE